MIWKYLTQRDADELIAWTNAKLDDEPRVVGSYMFLPWVTRSEAEQIMDGFGVPLPDKRGRPRDEKVWEARRDVDLIRQIWKQHKEFLDSKFKRPQYRNGKITVTAEQIAADRSHVKKVGKVRNRLHKKKEKA